MSRPKRKPAKSREASPNAGTNAFKSLTWALDGRFDKKLAKLPAKIGKWVEDAFHPVPWDALSPEQRRYHARQWDYQHDPATDHERERWWEFSSRFIELEEQIQQWETMNPSTAQELATKEERLDALRREHRSMQTQMRRVVDRYEPPRPSRRSRTHVTYWPYLKALEALKERLGATDGELAAWIFLGPDHGGLNAYCNANEIEPPPRFHFESYMGESYRSAMMKCWFAENDIRTFSPSERYVTGRELIARWEARPGLQAVAYICAKIAESRLQDLHPTYGISRGSDPEDEALPPLEDALFARSEIEAIEAEEFGAVPRDPRSPSTGDPPIGSREWRSELGRRAANMRHDKPGGSREKRARLIEIWRSGKYSDKNRCAEEECGALGMAFSTARKALINL